MANIHAEDGFTLSAPRVASLHTPIGAASVGPLPGPRVHRATAAGGSRLGRFRRFRRDATHFKRHRNKSRRCFFLLGNNVLRASSRCTRHASCVASTSTLRRHVQWMRHALRSLCSSSSGATSHVTIRRRKASGLVLGGTVRHARTGQNKNTRRVTRSVLPTH